MAIGILPFAAPRATRAPSRAVISKRVDPEWGPESELRVVLAVLSKELREAFRDASVLLYSVAFPLVLYPLLLWGAVQLLVLQAGLVDRQPPRVEVDAAPEVMEALLAEPVVSGEGGRAALLAGDLDAVVTAEGPGEGTLSLLWRSTRARSERARDLVEDRLELLRAERMEDLAARVGLPPDALCPWRVTAREAAGSERVALLALARVIPLLALTTLMMSVVYPMVEVLVGERERGTLETTLVAAVPRWAVVVGKLLAVSLTGLLALAGSGVAIWATLSGLAAEAGGAALSLGPLGRPSLVLAVLALLLLSPATAAWIGLCLLPARTFKSGQNRATLVVTVGLALAAPCLSTAAEPSWAWAAIPVAGTAMALRGAIAGGLGIGPILTAAAVNLGLCALGFALGARVLGREDFLFGQRLPRWLSWIEERRP